MPETEPAELGKPVHTSLRRQISTIARRQVRLVVADRAYFVFLALLPFILGSLSLTVPGSSGFHIPAENAGTPDESAQILSLLLPAAAFMGIALTIRDLVGERAIFRREQAVGLSSSAYLLAKTAVFCGFAILQAAIITAIVVVGKGAPTRGAVVMGHGTVAATVELFTTVAATCVASAILGLAISAVVRSTEQVMPLFVVAVMAQLVLCGGMVPVTGRLGLDQLSFAMPDAVGVRRRGVDGRRADAGARFGAAPGPVLGAHAKDLAVRHGHAGRVVAVLRLLCPLEDPAAPVEAGRVTIIHPPKNETFDLVARTNTDPKGIVRAVDEYTLQPWGLYLARPTPGRAQFHYLESWLLPSLGLRATVFHFNPGHERDHDYYLDVGEYTPGPAAWRSEDHYLDIEVRTGVGAELADVDELLDAVRQRPADAGGRRAGGAARRGRHRRAGPQWL